MTSSAGPLRWREHTGPYRLVSSCDRYRVQVIHGNKGVRYLAWHYPWGYPVEMNGWRFSGGPPEGLFAMRREISAAKHDAQLHAQTGEIRR